MTHEFDCKEFQALLNASYLGKPVTEEEAVEAYRNMGEFITLLVRVNERAGIVPMDMLESDGEKP